MRPGSEFPGQRQLEDRSEPSIAIFNVIHGPGTTVDVYDALPHAARVDEVGHGEARRHAHQVLALDEDAIPDRAFPQAADFGKAVVARIELVAQVAAPRPRCAG